LHSQVCDYTERQTVNKLTDMGQNFKQSVAKLIVYTIRGDRRGPKQTTFTIQCEVGKETAGHERLLASQKWRIQ